MDQVKFVEDSLIQFMEDSLNLADHIPSIFLKVFFQKIFLLHSWIICPICSEDCFAECILD